MSAGKDIKNSDQNGKSKTEGDSEVELSAEELEKILAEEDPNFINSLGEIAKDKSLSIAQLEELSVDQQYLIDTRERLAKSRAGRIILRIFPFLPRLLLLRRKFFFYFVRFLQAQKVRLKNFIFYIRNTGRQQAIQYIKDRFNSFRTKQNEFSRWLRFLPGKLKLALVGLLFLTFGVGSYIYYAIKFNILETKETLFASNLENQADEVFIAGENEVQETFYENIRVVRNLFLVPKIVVNLKRSKNSGTNPMGAFEFFVESYSPETLIEFKDREVEMKDVMFRTIEAFTFDQIDTAEGKNELSIFLAQEVNRKLKTGRLKRVFIKTAILKP